MLPLPQVLRFPLMVACVEYQQRLIYIVTTSRHYSSKVYRSPADTLLVRDVVRWPRRRASLSTTLLGSFSGNGGDQVLATMATVSHGIEGVGRFLRKEFVAAWPVFLFFLTGFVFLILLIKLALAQFSIEVMAVPNAVVGALFAAKAALVLDETPLSRSLEKYRRIVAVAVKTFFYGVATLLLGYVERLLEALHRVHSFNEAIRDVINHGNHYRMLVWALGISMVFALYFAFFEISQRMGKGALRALFFESPAVAGGSDRSSKIGAGKRRS